MRKGQLKKYGNYMDDVLMNIPLVLPDIKIDGEKVKGWRFRVITYDIEGKKPYIYYEYVNPKNSKQYVFHSAYFDELFDYLKDFNLLNKQE